MRRCGLSLAIVMLMALGTMQAGANPRELPMSYPVETLPAEALEVEQIIDTTPVRALDSEGVERWTPRSRLLTELEYGLTQRLEAGFYLQFVDRPDSTGGTPLAFDGIKLRLRYRLSDPGSWPIDVGIYGEVAPLRDEVEVEGKIILQRHFGPVRVLTNLWAEREYYYDGRREWVLHPTLGVSFELNPRIRIGAEAWMVAEFGDTNLSTAVGQYNAGPHIFAGPTVMVQGKRAWLSLGAYLRTTQFSHPARIGDAFGRFWLRAMIGIDL